MLAFLCSASMCWARSTHIAAMVTMARAMEAKGNHDEARRWAERAVATDPSAVPIAVYLADLLLKMKEYLPKTRKIILTGYPDLETAIGAVNKRADGYLIKPVDPEALLKVIDEQIMEQGKELKYTQEKVVEYIKSRVEQIEK